MRIGIVTFTRGDNFGQRLQNYALQEYLKKFADEVFTIPQNKHTNSVRTIFRKFKYNLFHINAFLSNTMRHIKFMMFDKNMINYYRPIKDEKSLSIVKNDFDYFVCGSDQIWSPFSPFVDDTMFLIFADKKQRISYAASIAGEYIPKDKEEYFIRYWKGFDEISIREERLKHYIEQNTGVTTSVHIDPTLLHTMKFWSTLATVPKNLYVGKFVFCYILGDKSHVQEVLDKYNVDGLKIIDVMNDPKYYAISPTDFLGMIIKSEFVVTDSYHGTIFSIIFHKPFVIVNRLGETVVMKSRFETLFDKLSIGDRWAESMSVENMYALDYIKIGDSIKQEQKRTKEYFQRRIRR